MHRIRGKLTYSNVVATLALFLVLAGGTAFAAKQMLPRNSIGTKQLRKLSVTKGKIAKGAVTGTKIADGAVTGTKVQTSSLGIVPNATHAVTADTATKASAATSADSATTAKSAESANTATTAKSADSATRATSAGTADQAKALDGLEAGAFARSNQQFFGSATVGATNQTLFNAGGIEVQTVGGAGSEYKVAFRNTNSASWDATVSYDTGVRSLGGGATNIFSPTGSRATTFTLVDTTNVARFLVVVCGSDFLPNILFCTGQLSPAGV